MLLPQDINPEKSLYVIGGRIIDTFNSLKRKLVDVYVLYDRFVVRYEMRDLSFNYFLYALDWLYMLGFIDLNKNKIKRCF